MLLDQYNNTVWEMSARNCASYSLAIFTCTSLVVYAAVLSKPPQKRRSLNRKLEKRKQMLYVMVACNNTTECLMLLLFAVDVEGDSTEWRHRQGDLATAIDSDRLATGGIVVLDDVAVSASR